MTEAKQIIDEPIKRKIRSSQTNFRRLTQNCINKTGTLSKINYRNMDERTDIYSKLDPTF